MKNIEEKLLNFLDQTDKEEENYENFINIINEENILINRYDFKTILYLISKISTNHHQLPDFYHKIEKILEKFKEEITNFFSNDEIFQIFESNKRILLFLKEEKIFAIDHSIYKEMITDKYKEKQYPEYFSFEIEPFIEKEFKNNEKQKYEQIQTILKEDFGKFNEKRKKGRIDGYLYEIIQNDLIDEFITYVNKKKLST